MIDVIKTMQEQQNALVTNLKSSPEDYQKLLSSLQKMIDQQEDPEISLSVIHEVEKLLDTFKNNTLYQLRTQQELLEMKSASFDAVISNVGLSILQMDENGLITEYNEKAAALFTHLFDRQISREDTLIKLFSDEQLQLRCQKNINYCLMGKSGQLSEVVSRNKKSHILNLRFYPIWTKEDICGVSIIIEDLTQKHQEDSLFRLLNSAVIYANDAILVTEVKNQVNRESSIIYVNKAFCKMSGYSAKELIGNSTEMVQGSDDDNGELHKLNEAIQNGESYRSELNYFRKDGSPYWVNSSIVPLKDDKNQVTHWISIQRDVTDSRQAEETIREQKNFLESINRNSSEAIICADVQKKPRFTNKAFQELFQYTDEDIILDDLFADNASQIDFNKLLTSEGKVSNSAYLFKRKDGSTFWGLASFSIHEYEGKKQYDGTIRDISDIKATEQVLQEKNQALEKTNEELDRFVYSASHDLRAPLASSLGLINITRISTDEKEKQSYLDMMEQSLNKMDKIIQDITDYQRNSRLQIETEEIHFESLIADVFQRLKYLKSLDVVRINTQIDNEEKFYTDKIRLYVILINLISNAIKFMQFDVADPYINIKISVDSQRARILVEDNGIGIDASHLDKVFGMFFQASRESTGSGLGLYIVKESINKLKGSIQVSSTLNEGTCVEIILPNEKK